MVCMCVCGSMSGERRACKGVFAPENTDPNLGKHTNDHLMGFPALKSCDVQLNVSVRKHMTRVCEAFSM